MTPIPSIEASASNIQEMLFIDSRVPDLQAIMAAARPGVKIVVLGEHDSGVAQMARALQGEHGLLSVSVVSHGDAGLLLLGNAPLFAGNLQQHEAQLEAIGAALAPGGDLLLYGCNVGAGDKGASFIAALAQATGVDVAASSNTTGGFSTGGDWHLEVTTGDIEAAPVLLAEPLLDYAFSLHATSVGTLAELQAAIAAGNGDGQDDIIALTRNIVFTSAADTVKINVTDGHTMRIVGGGYMLSGNDLARVLEVDTSNGSAVQISGLTIANGLVAGAGGGIGFDSYAASAAKNAGAGQDALGAGIWNKGTLSLVASSVIDNKAAGGGGGGINSNDREGAQPGRDGNTDANPNVNYNNYSNYGVGDYRQPNLGGIAGNGASTIFGGGGGSSGNMGTPYNLGYVSSGNGGHAVGGIYNSGTLTLVQTNIANNLGAGGGGGSGLTVMPVYWGGSGGIGVGALWNTGGTVKMDASTYLSLGEGNGGAGGKIDPASDKPLPTRGQSIDGILNHSGSVETDYIVGPTLTSALYDGDTGTLVVTGTGMVATAGAGNDIAVSKLTLTGQGGVSHTLTSASVELQSPSQFTVVLNSADQHSIAELLNKKGVSAQDAKAYFIAAAAGWNPAGASGADITGNPVVVRSVQGPAITSASYDAATGTLVVTGARLVGTSGVDDIVASKLTFIGEGGASHTLASTASVEITSSTSFTLTLSASDKTAVGQIANMNGGISTTGTAYQLSAASGWTTNEEGAPAPSDSTDNAITVSNVPVPTIQAASYAADAGVLTVTGNGLLQKAGANNDIDISKLTLIAEGDAAYTLTDTSNVEISSATGFTVTLSATDRAAFNQIANKNGSSSTGGSTYNLAAAEDWAAGAEASVVVADLAGNGITVSHVAVPAIQGASYNAATGQLTVTGSGFLQRGGAQNDIDASKLRFDGAGGVIRPLTDTANVDITSGTSFTLQLGAADQAAVNLIATRNGSSAVDSTAYQLRAFEDWAAGADAAVTVADLAGKPITVSQVPTAALDIGVPDDGTYGVGKILDFSVTYSEAVNVSTTAGRPFFWLGIDSGVPGGQAKAEYLSGSGSSVLVFRYIVGPGHSDADGITLGSSIVLPSGSSMLSVTGSTVLSPLPAAGLSGVQVDAVAPAVLSIERVSAEATNAASVQYTVTFTKPVTGVDITGFVLTCMGSAGGTVAGVSGTGDTYVVTVSSLIGEGSLLLDLRATGTGINDAIGNAIAGGFTSGQQYTVDRVPPAAPNTLALTSASDSGISNSDNITNITTPTVTGAAEANSTVTLYDADGSTVLGTTSTTGDGQWIIVTGDLSEGVHTLIAHATDHAGNTSTASASLSVTIDTTAPTANVTRVAFSADTGNSDSDFITSVAAQTITGTLSAALEAGEKVQVSLDNGASWMDAISPLGDQDLSVMATLAASDTLQVRLMDVAGNIRAAISQPYVLDTTPPTASINVVQSKLTPGSTSLVTFTFSEKITGLDWSDLSVANATLTGLSSADGGQTWMATLTPTAGVVVASNVITLNNSGVSDLAGNVGTGTTDSNHYDVDTSVPLSPPSPPEPPAPVEPVGPPPPVPPPASVEPPTPPAPVPRPPAPAEPQPPTPPSLPEQDKYGIPAAIEDSVPGLGRPDGSAPIAGDGNGDGIKDSQQAEVASVAFVLSASAQSSPGAGVPTFTTLVASSVDGKVNSGTANARITSLKQLDAPSELPEGLNMPIGLISFTVALASGVSSESFSLYLDPALGINGYWKQDSAGTWVNIASAPYGGKVVMEGGRVRLDFEITDGGAFDADGKADGVITDPGAPAFLALSIVGHAPAPVEGGFWF